MSLLTFCSTPRTLAECRDEGYTHHQLYNLVKRGFIVNLNRKDDWGRVQRGKGLFVVADPSERIGGTEFDLRTVTTTLTTAWR